MQSPTGSRGRQLFRKDDILEVVSAQEGLKHPNGARAVVVRDETSEKINTFPSVEVRWLSGPLQPKFVFRDQFQLMIRSDGLVGANLSTLQQLEASLTRHRNGRQAKAVREAIREISMARHARPKYSPAPFQSRPLDNQPSV